MIAAFGGSPPPVALEGGQGSAWRAGDVVLKPVDRLEAELAWQLDVLGSLACDGFRVAPPRRARDGALVADGWCAWEAVAGRHDERRWSEIVSVGERFHAALAAADRPAFLAERSDPWAIVDRVAWGELPASEHARVRHVAQLAARRRPVAGHSQLVHGDLTGNVLFHPSLPPAVIDLSPYWRPTALASAIVVADALVWEGADESILQAVAHVEDLGQHLLRALIFRVVVDHLFRPDHPPRSDADDPFLAAVELACSIA